MSSRPCSVPECLSADRLDILLNRARNRDWDIVFGMISDAIQSTQDSSKVWKTLASYADTRSGNTLLHYAVRDERMAEIRHLVHVGGANGLAKNQCGISPFRAAADLKFVEAALELSLRIAEEQWAKWRSELPRLVRILDTLPDFELWIDWRVTSWVPFLSYFLPSDTIKLYKRGSSLRFDSSLAGRDGKKAKRGHFSFIFTVKDGAWAESISEQQEIEMEEALASSSLEDDTTSSSLATGLSRITDRASASKVLEDLEKMFSVYFVDHVREVYYDALEQARNPLDQFLRGKLVESLKKDNTHRDISFDWASISFAPNTKMFSKKQKRQVVSGYDCALWTVKDIHITASETKLASGDDVLEQVHSKPSIKKKTYSSTVWMCDDENFPLRLEDLTSLFDVLSATDETMKNLRKFLDGNYLPPGFPMKLEIPVYPAIYAEVTFEKLEFRDIDPAAFIPPPHYKKESIIRELGGELTEEDKYKMESGLMSDNMPDGWEAVYDEQTGYFCFVNHTLEITQWEDPRLADLDESFDPFRGHLLPVMANRWTFLLLFLSSTLSRSLSLSLSHFSVQSSSGIHS